jgi:tetratricopeptide (TPR) repeat protein
VRFADSQQPAIGALVHCNGTGGTSEQLTDRLGKFYFRVSPGHYDVDVRFPGYRDQQQSVDLLDTRSSEYMRFRLRPEGSVTKTVSSPSTVDESVPSEAQKEFDKGAAIINEGKKEKMPEGIAHLERAVSLYPTYLQAHLMLGTTYMDLQQWDKAEKALRKALEIAPKAANAYFALGEVYLRQKKYDQAEKVLQDGFGVEARSAQAHLTLARVYWEKVSGVKDEAQWRPPLEKAYEEVKQALALDPNLAAAHLLKGNLLFKVRRAEDAQKEFEEYLRLDPNGQSAEQTRALVEKIKKALAQKQ